MATASDNAGNVDYKPLISTRFDLERRAYISRADRQVPHNTAAATIATNVFEAKVENERNVAKSRKITETATPSTVVDYHYNTAWERLRPFATSWTVTKTSANSSGMPTPLAAVGSVPSLTGAADSVELNPANWDKDVIEVTAWQTLTDKLYDEELGSEILRVRSVVLPSASLPTPTAISWGEMEQVDALRSILTTYTLVGDVSGGLWSKTRYQTIDYTFPALLASWDGNPANAPVAPNWTLGSGWVASTFETANKRTVFAFILNLREAFSAGVRANVVEEIITATSASTLLGAADNTTAFGTNSSFGTMSDDLGTATTRARIFVPRPRDLNYDGLMFNLHVPNVICNGATLTATSSSEDTYYDDSLAEAYTFQSSFPTLTDYLSYIGKVVCIEDSITPWRGGLFKRRRVCIKVQ